MLDDITSRRRSPGRSARRCCIRRHVSAAAEADHQSRRRHARTGDRVQRLRRGTHLLIDDAVVEVSRSAARRRPSPSSIAPRCAIEPARRPLRQTGTPDLGTMPALPLRTSSTHGVRDQPPPALSTRCSVMFAVGALQPLLGVVAYESIAHVDLFMTVQDDVRDRFGIPLWFGMVMLTVGIGVYSQRRAVSLRGFQTALAALAAGTARHARELSPVANGPLAIPRDAVDVRCIYCATDNLVALPASWVVGLAAAADRVALASRKPGHGLRHVQTCEAAAPGWSSRTPVLRAVPLPASSASRRGGSHVDGPSARLRRAAEVVAALPTSRAILACRRESGRPNQWSSGFADR